MTNNITNTTTRQDFAALVATYYARHNDYSRLLNESDGDPADSALEAVTAARKALIATPAPDWQAVQEKATVLAQFAFEAEVISYNEMKALLDDIARLRGVGSFDAADWLYRWTEFRGGYVVQDSKVNLVTPADHYCPHRCALIGELDIAKGRDALSAYILSGVANEANDQPATDFEALKQAVADAYDKAENRSNTEAETDQATAAFNDALKALMAYPATSGAQLADKLKTFREFECGEYVEEIRNPMLDAFEADARRIGGAA